LVKSSQDSYYFLPSFGRRFAYFQGPSIDADRWRLPSIVSILLMNVTDPKAWPLDVEPRRAPSRADDNDSGVARYDRSHKPRRG